MNTPADTSGPTHHDFELVARAALYYANPELRAKIMREVPRAYNAVVGREVIAVVRTEDGSRI